MNRAIPILAFGLACAVATTPILAQREQGREQGRGGERPSRQCMKEVAQLCGRDRSQMRSCLQEKASELSDTCQNELRQRMERRGGRDDGPRRPYQAAVNPTRTVIFGEHSRQQVDVYEPSDAVDELPLVLYIHGGGWTAGAHKRVGAKPAWLGGEEIYFASAGYRLVPDVSVEDQARDIGNAVQALVGQAGAIGFDSQKIVLMGHSAGAHLAALVAADPQYTGKAFGSIKGAVLLDGAGYDVPAAIANARPEAWQIYNRAFGNDPARQQVLSPITHVGGSDAPNWLALYVDTRATSKAQSEALVAALNDAGSTATTIAISDTDHARINRELGTKTGAAQTEAVTEFLEKVFE